MNIKTDEEKVSPNYTGDMYSQFVEFQYLK